MTWVLVKLNAMNEGLTWCRVIGDERATAVTIWDHREQRQRIKSKLKIRERCNV
jgi:alkylated DNA nucleotide flippase Atl1